MANLTDYSNTDLWLSQASYKNRPFQLDKNEAPNGLYVQEKITDSKTGYTAYFLTDQKSINNSTSAYYVVRGSDAFSNKNPDWFDNNVPFALENKQVKQSKNFSDDISKKMNEYSNLKNWKFTGHSLATMVITTGLSNLNEGQARKVDTVNLFNGPDVSNSLSKKQLSNLKDFGLSSKINYYLNPDDMVSVLNRSNQTQIGNINFIKTKSEIGTMGIAAAHDFYEYISIDKKIKTIPFDFSLRSYIYAQDTLYQQLISYIKKEDISPIQIQNAIKKIGKLNSFERTQYLISEFGENVNILELVKIFNHYLESKTLFNQSIKIENMFNERNSGDKIFVNDELIEMIKNYVADFLSQTSFDTQELHDTTKTEIKKLIKTQNEMLLNEGLPPNLYPEMFYSNSIERNNLMIINKYKNEMNDTVHRLDKHIKNIFELDSIYAHSVFDKK